MHRSTRCNDKRHSQRTRTIKVVSTFAGLASSQMVKLATISAFLAAAYIRVSALQPSASASAIRQRRQQQRRPAPRAPFPNGDNGGTIITLPPEQTFGYTEEDNPLLQAVSSAVAVDGDSRGGDQNSQSSPNSILLPPRTIRVWLPPTYELSGTSRHPVLYVHDGQNAIDDEQSWTGHSWRMAGALVRLAERGYLEVPSAIGAAGDDSDSDEVDPMPILVLLPSAEGDLLPGVRRRHLEYGDTSIPVAQAHADFVAHRVLPLINARFRTLADCPAATSAIGTSMGGQASLHLLLRHPDKFGAAAMISPAFQLGTIAAVAASADLLRDKILYMDNGGDDEPSNVKVPFFEFLDHLTPRHWWNPGYFWLDTQLQPSIDAMRAAMDLVGIQYKYEKFAGGRHNERAWASRIANPLVHLFGRRET